MLMRHFCALFALAVVLAASVAAQTFPEPGTGAFTWQRVGDRPRDFEALSFTPGGRLFAARDTVFVFDPAPEGPPAGRWRAVGYTGGLTKALLALDSAGDTLFTGKYGYTFRSTNGGTSWSLVNGSLSGGGDAGGPDDPDGFFVLAPGHSDAGRLLAGGVITYSDDRGATWHDATQDIPLNSQSNARTFAALPSGRVLAGTGGGVLASQDGGAAYRRTPLWSTFVIESLVAFATPGSVQSGSPSCGLPDTALCDGALAVGYSSQLTDARVWRTNDGGRTWSESVALPEPFDGAAAGASVGTVALSPGADGLGRAVTVLGRGVVYATRDGGQTWTAVGRMPLVIGGASHYPQFARLGPDGHLWVSTTMNGVAREWMYRSAEPAEAAFAVAGEASPVEAPDIDLSVRPNPAGAHVEVAVTLAEAGPVRVVVVDALGREVAVVLVGTIVAGERIVSVDTGSWPAGVYVVRVTAGAREASARFTVVR